MRSLRWQRALFVLGSGALLLQATSCSFTDVNEFLQTMLLGVTAAGAVAVIRNI